MRRMNGVIFFQWKERGSTQVIPPHFDLFLLVLIIFTLTGSCCRTRIGARWFYWSNTIPIPYFVWSLYEIFHNFHNSKKEGTNLIFGNAFETPFLLRSIPGHLTKKDQDPTSLVGILSFANFIKEVSVLSMKLTFLSVIFCASTNTF